MELPAELGIVIKEQQGLVSRRQLLDSGVTAATVRWRLGRSWRYVLPGVVATFTGPLTPRHRVIAAQLYAGPGSIISSSTAAAWHGVESARAPLIRVMVPANRAARQAGFVVIDSTTREDPSCWQRPPLVIASRHRSVVDAARDAASERQASAIVIESVQRRLVNLDGLRHELARAPRRGSKRVRLGLAAAERGAWSLPELDLGELVAASRSLPEAWPNAELSRMDGSPLPTPDLWFDDVGLAVQIHSRAYHLRDLDWDATVAGDTALGEYGIVALGVTPAMIGRRPSDVLARIERSHRSLRGRPRPEVLAVPRVPW